VTKHHLFSLLSIAINQAYLLMQGAATLYQWAFSLTPNNHCGQRLQTMGCCEVFIEKG